MKIHYTNKDEDGFEHDYRQCLVIEWLNGSKEEHWDGGEPEDNYFFRDWSWIDEALQKAYEDGIRVGIEQILEGHVP